MLKTTFHKEEPKTLIYRDYKTFSLETFTFENNEYQTFEKKKIVGTLNSQTPKKSKIVRDNQKSHINKALRNSIMK